jgi:hypothetical protein
MRSNHANVCNLKQDPKLKQISHLACNKAEIIPACMSQLLSSPECQMKPSTPLFQYQAEPLLKHFKLAYNQAENSNRGSILPPSPEIRHHHAFRPMPPKTMSRHHHHLEKTKGKKKLPTKHKRQIYQCMDLFTLTHLSRG